MSLLELYPEWLHNIPAFAALQAAYEQLTAERRALWADILSQCNLDTATWGLALWEDRLSLTPPATLDDEGRRELIRTRLRGGGPVNAAYLSQLASAIVGQPVRATEHNPEAWLELTWNHPGYPSAYAALMAEILRLIPAHVEPVLVPYWARWRDLHAGQVTMGQLDRMTWAQVHVYEPPTT